MVTHRGNGHTQRNVKPGTVFKFFSYCKRINNAFLLCFHDCVVLDDVNYNDDVVLSSMSSDFLLHIHPIMKRLLEHKFLLITKLDDF